MSEHICMVDALVMIAKFEFKVYNSTLKSMGKMHPVVTP